MTLARPEVNCIWCNGQVVSVGRIMPQLWAEMKQRHDAGHPELCNCGTCPIHPQCQTEES